MEWLTSFNIYVQGMILAAIIVGVLSLTVSILYLFNVNISKQRMKYVYAFSSGFLIVTAIVGQWVSARSSLTHHFEDINMANNPGTDGDPTIGQSMLSIIIVVAGIFVGTIMAYGMKKVASHNHTHDETVHSKHSHHIHGDHPDLMSTQAEVIHEAKIHKERSTVIYMILTHRVPAGLVLGILLVNFNNGGEYSLAALLVFVLHTIPDMMIVYYARIEAGYSRKSSFWFSIGAKLIIVPFIILGIVMSTYIDMDGESTYWIIPFLLSLAGVVMVWGAVFELAPSFIHIKNNKETYKLIFTFLIGLTASMAIQLIHHH